jgi:hypothetical protein
MNADAFIHQMQRYEEEIALQPDTLRSSAAREELINSLERFERELDLLIAALRGDKR